MKNPDLLAQQTEQNFNAIMKDSGKFFRGQFQNKCMEVVRSDQRPKHKYIRLVELIEQAGNYIAPHTACTQGCHHCCHMAVTITGYEAKVIGEYIGVPPQSVPMDIEHVMSKSSDELQEELRDTYSGKDCCFLVEGQCSIYSVRPLACRAYFNISGEPSLCDLTLGSNDVPSIDFTVLWAAHAQAFLQYEFGDIRQFFPTVEAGVVGAKAAPHEEVVCSL